MNKTERFFKTIWYVLIVSNIVLSLITKEWLLALVWLVVSMQEYVIHDLETKIDRLRGK